MSLSVTRGDWLGSVPWGSGSLVLASVLTGMSTGSSLWVRGMTWIRISKMSWVEWALVVLGDCGFWGVVGGDDTEVEVVADVSDGSVRMKSRVERIIGTRSSS